MTARYRRRALAAAALTAANLIVLNVWLGPFARLRVDLTGDRAYSLSPATVSLLHDLAEPLLIRAYLSERKPVSGSGTELVHVKRSIDILTEAQDQQIRSFYESLVERISEDHP